MVKSKDGSQVPGIVYGIPEVASVLVRRNLYNQNVHYESWINHMHLHIMNHACGLYNCIPCGFQIPKELADTFKY
jgi:hypothetical protein